MIVPSIDIQNGRAVQLRRGREFVLDGGDPLDRLAEFSVVGEVAVVDLDAAMGVGSNADLIREMVRRAPCRIGGGIRSIEAAREWLDNGAARLVIGTAATPEFCAALPRERIIAAVDADQGTVVVEGWRTKTGDHVLQRIESLAPHVGGFLLTQVEHEGALAGFDRSLVEQARSMAQGVRVTAAGGITTTDHIAALERLDVDAQVGMALYIGRFTLGDALAASLDKPIDGRLWPTVVCDELGQTLGLVWSSRESLVAAVNERRGIYWSRSRDELWIKGATSGATQGLLRVELDCDRDALRFTVRQAGSGFCHTGSRSCWPDRFDLSVLERVVSDRRQSPSPGSGTTRLLDDAQLLAAKLREEAGELADAADAAEAAHEAADLIYFLMVALARRGATLHDVQEELARRNLRVHRRPMIAKHQKTES